MKRVILAVLVMMVIAVFSPAAYASGLGFYLNTGSGDSVIDRGDTMFFDFSWGVFNTTTSDIEVESFGLVFDTNLSEDMLFNYRLELGTGKHTLKSYPLGVEVELKQTVMTHDFGFGLYRSDGVRFWLGPEIRISQVKDNDKGYSYDMMGFGFGLAMGVNINLKGSVTIALKGSMLRENLYGDIDYRENLFGYYTSEDISMDNDLSIITAGLIFRFNEVY